MRGFSRCPGALAASDIRRVSNLPARRRTFDATSTSGNTALTTEPGRRLGVVAEHPPAPVRRPHEVDGIEGDPASRQRLQPVTSPQEDGIRVEPVRGQGALAYEPARAVEVAEDGLVEPGALDDRPFQIGLFGPVDDARDEVEGPGALPGAAPPVGVDRSCRPAAARASVTVSQCGRRAPSRSTISS